MLAIVNISTKVYKQAILILKGLDLEWQTANAASECR